MTRLIIKETDFRKELKDAPRAGYLFFGEEDYLKSIDIKLARETLCPDPGFAFFNDLRIDALDFDAEKLMDAIMPMPMMADRKLITVSGLNFLTMKPTDLDALCEVLGTLSQYDYNVVILSVASDCFDPGFLPKRPSAVLKKLEEVLTPVWFERSTPSNLAKWVQKHFQHNGVNASPEFCSKMVEYCGRSMFELAGEIDKLSFYERSHERTEVSDADMVAVCTPAVEYDAFAFTNAIMAGRQDKALEILADYRFRRVEPLYILGDVIRVICDMVSVRALQREGATSADIASALKLHEFKVGLYQKSLRDLSDKRLQNALNACADADASLKLSPQGYAALERLISCL